MSLYSLTHRPRRQRRSHASRLLYQETHLTRADLIQPLFVVEGVQKATPIRGLEPCAYLSLDQLEREASELLERGILALLLFPVIENHQKNPRATEALNPQGLLPRAIRLLKQKYPELFLMVDLALDPFSSEGHDGLLDERNEVLNDLTVQRLCEIALLQAEAGADLIAPSDMMDGRVALLRRALDEAGFDQVMLLSYSAKYASSLYGPFRDALASAPQRGDKRGYQLSSANVKEALWEAQLDVEEGADWVMVKPALAYLDVLHTLSNHLLCPIAAYQVSGEYAMLKAASEKGIFDFDQALYECLLGIKRAGASMILSYGAKDIALRLPQLEEGLLRVRKKPPFHDLHHFDFAGIQKASEGKVLGSDLEKAKTLC